MGRQAETDVWRGVMLALSPRGYRLFRNQRYKGPIVSAGKITGAWADCGIGGDGGADLVGFRMVTITPDMVGTVMAQFGVIETKAGKGRRAQDQKDFIAAVRKAGGFGEFVGSVEEAKALFT